MYIKLTFVNNKSCNHPDGIRNKSSVFDCHQCGNQITLNIVNGKSLKQLKNWHYNCTCVGRPKSTLLDRSINAKTINPLHSDYEDNTDLVEDLLNQQFGKDI